MQTEKEAYEHWRDTFWKFGSSTDEARARRAWNQARAAVFVPDKTPTEGWEDIAAELHKPRANDAN